MNADTTPRVAPIAAHTNIDTDRDLLDRLTTHFSAEARAFAEQAIRIRDAHAERIDQLQAENVRLRSQLHSAYVVEPLAIPPGMADAGSVNRNPRPAAQAQRQPIEAFAVAMDEAGWRALGGMGGQATTAVVSSPFGRGFVVERRMPAFSDVPALNGQNGHAPWLPAAAAVLMVDFSEATGIAADIRTVTHDDFKARRFGAVVAPK